MRTESLVRGILSDTTDSTSLHTIQNALFDVGSTQVREALTYVSEHAQWLESANLSACCKSHAEEFLYAGPNRIPSP